MGLVNILQKMKLIQVSPGTGELGGEPPSTEPRPAAPSAAESAVAEILRDVPPAVLDETALTAPEGSALPGIPDFPAVYRAAGISEPTHGFSALKVFEILSSPDFAALDPKAKAAALSGFLKMNPAGPVAVADIIQDAVRRDQALDRFEEFLDRKLADRLAALEQDTARLQAEIDEIAHRHREQMQANRQTADEERARFAEFQRRKQAEEKRLFDAVAPFVEANPVSTPAPGTLRAETGPDPLAS